MAIEALRALSITGNRVRVNRQRRMVEDIPELVEWMEKHGTGGVISDYFGTIAFARREDATLFWLTFAN